VRLPKLSRLFGTISFRLTAAYAGVFTVSTLLLFGVVYWRTAGFAAQELDNAIELEFSLLIDAYRSEGFSALERNVTDRLRQERHFYLLQDATGRRIGNLPGLPRVAGWVDIELEERRGDRSAPRRRARGFGTPLPGGGYLLVGRDLAEVDALRDMVAQAFAWSIAATLLLALVGGAVISARFLARLEAISRATQEIIAGNLDRRLPAREPGDEFDRLSAAVNRMLDRIQALMDNLRQVSSDIAHDLRTPLSRLRQRLEDAKANARSIADYQATVEQAITDTESILGTFGALLRIAQIEAGSRRAQFAAVDLSELFDTVVEVYGPVAEDQGRSLAGRVEPGRRSWGDRELLTQMLANLVENALRHTPPGAHIAVDLQGQTGIIADDGSGIPAAERGKVFQRFYRLESSRTTPGSGLGLSLVAAIAELHDIAIELDDNHPGLKVTLRFPLDRVAPSA